jgi:hypothetical protein
MFAKKYYLILFLGLFPFVFSHPAMAVPGPDGPVDGVVYMERVPDDPGDLIHPLRVLGMSLGCTSWMSYSHDGLKANVVADPELEEEVCALIDILPVDYKDSFMIFDYGMYPPLVYLDRGAAHDSAFAWMEAKVKNQYDVRNFLLIGKQINPEDRTVEFRVKLKLPRTGPFANINSTLEGAFQAQILELLAATYSILGGAPEIQSAEEAGIEKLTQLLVAFLEGDFNGGITEEILILNGFQEFPIASSYNLNFFATNEPPAINGNIRDYARRKVYYQTGDTIEYVSVFAAAGISSFFDKFNLSSAFIFTDNSNYTQGASSEFENASIDFQYLDQTLIAWLHYFTFEDPAKPNKLYVKYDDNMTQEEAEAILDSLFNQYRYPSEPSDPPAVTSPKEKTGIFQRAEQRLNDCDSDPNSCDIFYWSNESGGWPKWRTKCCLMPHLDNLGNWVNVGVFNPLYLTLSQEAQDSMLMFIGGLGCGFVDGLIDVVATVGDVASFTGKALKHAPGTSMWFFDFLEKAWKKRALLTKGPKKTICKLLLGGCFVEGTAVWTASGVFSIEKLEPIHAPFFNPPGELRMVAPKVIFQAIPIR